MSPLYGYDGIDTQINTNTSAYIASQEVLHNYRDVPMPITNYTELKKAIEASSFRTDLDLLIPQFIASAESRMFNNTEEQLRIPEMDVYHSITVSTKKFSLPTEFLAIESVSLVDGNCSVQLPFKSTSTLPRKPATGRPAYFTINGTQIELDIAPDTSYQVDVQYVEKPTGLSVSNPTNSIIQKDFLVYLYGSLAALYLHVQDEQNAGTYYIQFIGQIKGLNRSASEVAYNPVPTLSLSPGSFTP